MYIDRLTFVLMLKLITFFLSLIYLQIGLMYQSLYIFFKLLLFVLCVHAFLVFFFYILYHNIMDIKFKDEILYVEKDNNNKCLFKIINTKFI